MRIKLVLLAALAALSGLALVPSANAASSYIKVTSLIDTSAACRPTPEQIRYSYIFSAKMKRRNSPRPKNVRISYKVIDDATGTTLVTGKVTLTAKNKWKRETAPITFQAGQSLSHKLVSVYTAPRSGKNVKATATIPLQLPTAQQMDELNAQNPAAPPFPACPA